MRDQVRLKHAAGVAGATAMMLVVSLMMATPAQAEDAVDTPRADTAGAADITISDTPVEESIAEPTVSDVEFAAVEAPDDYVEAAAVDESTGDVQQEELVEEADAESEVNAGVARIDLNSDVATVGVLWEREAPASVELRYLIGGEWSEWVDLEVKAVEDPDAAPDSGGGTEPAVMVDTTAVEVIAFTEDGQQTSDFTVSVIDPRGEDPVENALESDAEETGSAPAETAPVDPEQTAPEPTTPEPTAPAPTAPGQPEQDPAAPGDEVENAQTMELMSAAAAQPTFEFANESTAPQQMTTASLLQSNLNTGFGLTIKSRKAWGANEDWRKCRGNSKCNSSRWVSPNTKYRGAVVHHTFLPNSNYTQAQVPAVIRSIYQYHTRGVNFGDVGYQLLVDKFGGVWEGRYDSLKRSLVGAQALGANHETFGISVIGDYTNAAPPAKAQDSTARAIAWMFKKYGIKNPKGTIKIPHQSGRGATVPTILGHYQATATACPGAAFIKRLPALRNKVEQYMASAPRSGTPVAPFADVWSNDRYATEIAWMASSGITTGSKKSWGNEYRPNALLTRQAMAAYLYKLSGSKYKGPAVSPFADVKKGSKYYKQITWMHQQGLYKGVKQKKGKPLFKPDKNVTRALMAAIMYRMDAESKSYKKPSASYYGDVSTKHTYYRQISWARELGLSTGYPQSSGKKPLYKPKQNVTRAEMAGFMYHYKHR